MKSASFFLLSALLLSTAWTSSADAQEVTFGAGAAADPAPYPPPAASGTGASSVPNDQEGEWALRDRQMNEAATLNGGVGLVHLQHAAGGAAGQFRVGFTTEYFSAGFLCTNTQSCPNPTNAAGSRVTNDSTDHIGGHLTIEVQILKWLEAYLSTSAYANSDTANRPSLLQVLGDSTLGAKAFGKVGNVFSFGGAFDLWLVNGTGSVGLDGGGTGAKFRGLATADLRGMGKPLPLRFSTNLQYVLDNTAQVITQTETNRGTPITRIERFGLGINRVDHFDIGLGGEVFLAQEKVRPFIEYNIAIPINRQNYLCHPTNPSNDGCLANNKVAPSSITFGGRFFPWKRGFNLLVALDVGVSGTSTFIEEVKPEAPWMLYLGAGWAFDTQDRPPVYQERLVEKPVAKNTGRKIRGLVHEEGMQDVVPGAIVSWDNHSELTSLVTAPDGHFTTHPLDEGNYVFGIKAEGYKPAQCTTSIVRPASPPGYVSKKSGTLPPAEPPAENTGGGDVQLDCPLVALPRVGQIVGKLKDADTQAPIPNATIKFVDVAKKEYAGTADQNGAFRLADVMPGAGSYTADAEGYLAATDAFDVKPRIENPADILLHKRPKNSNVTVGKGEIIIKQQIQFALDSSTILPESNGLLSEIADALIKNPRIHRVEVQGHTDNTGTPDHNNQLSNDRAQAVATWLTSHGVAGDRLTPKGYGQSKPLVPNVTAGNRARNRRVQFIITDQDPAGPPAPAKK